MNYDQIIYDTAIANGYNSKACEIIVAHARVITDDYKSGELISNNNFFGLRYVRQPLASKGSKIKSNASLQDSDNHYYAKYSNPEDSVRDLVWRLYSRDINGIPQFMLQEVRSVDEYAELLKKRDFYDGNEYRYANAIRNKLFSVKIIDIVNEFKSTAERHKPAIMLCLVGVATMVGLLKYM
jgi:hypothetical protein